jgi:hypothetical protein
MLSPTLSCIFEQTLTGSEWAASAGENCVGLLLPSGSSRRPGATHRPLKRQIHHHHLIVMKQKLPVMFQPFGATVSHTDIDMSWLEGNEELK